ncbi:alpha/beta fold hydrolase [Streptomyces hainanensis]|uniref:Alpha/beta hydrolase n=1 Tax=Streptomyces hainanensis TaxID=402648 RepID=A0A4R4SWK8_9ACTN|nr:alpha/beta hydrolase [Streptomyces hainanensis]TDC68631.1 alpha/beta hydrolase [Streptomyces hainanensis]
MEGFTSEFAEVNGVRLHYVVGGEGDPLVLLPGWPRTWYQFRGIMPPLAEHRRVIAVDLRGMGDSAKPQSGYDKKTMARDIRELVRFLGYERVDVAGEDIGSQVAFSFAANHPEATRRIALWETGHPTEIFNELRMLPQPGQPAPWWFAFNQLDGLPGQLLEGRFRYVVDWLIDYQATTPEAFGEEARARYAAAYDTPDAIRAANGWYQTFGQDIEDLEDYPVLTMPLLALGGIYYQLVLAQLEGRATDVRLVELAGAGHYLAEERPDDIVRELTAFLG